MTEQAANVQDDNNGKNQPAPDKSGVPGAGEGKGAGNNPVAEKGAGDGANKAAATGIYKPAGIPDHMVGSSDKETIDKLFANVDGYRKENAKKGIPESPDGYTMSVADDLKGKIFQLDESGKDPVFEKFRPVFHELKLSDTAANRLITELYTIVSEGAAGQDNEGGEAIDFEYSDLGGAAKAKPIVDAVVAGLNGLKNRGALDDADIAELSLATLHSGGLKAVRKLIEATGEKVIPASLDGSERADGLTEASINAMMKDERYWKANKKDPAYIAEVTKKFQQFYGGE